MTETPAPPTHAPREAPAEPEQAAQAATPAAEPVRLRVQLFDRMDGTWYRPAPFSKATHCVEFWNTVEIPDGMVDQFENAYAREVEEDIVTSLNAVMTPWGEAWLAENPKPRREKDQADWRTQFDAIFEERKAVVRAELAAKHPTLSFYDIPQLVRAAQMLQYRPTGDYWEEGNLIFSEWIELHEETLTVEMIEQKYHVSRFWPTLRQRPLPAPMAAAVSAIERVGSRIDALHSELNMARGTLIDIHRDMD